MESRLAQQLGTSIRAWLDPLARYAEVVTRTNPLGTADQLLARPDIRAILIEILTEARDRAAAVVQEAWDSTGAADHPLLDRLLADIERYWSVAHLDGLIRHAHASVPPRYFTPGVSQPGTNPLTEAAAERAAAVAEAIRGYAREVAFRSRMTVTVAQGAGRTYAALAGADVRREAGEDVRKRWRAHTEKPACCHWCRLLNGKTIPLHHSFEQFLDWNAHPRPPRPYHGLQGPLLHPFCECWLEIVTGPHVPPGGSQAAPGRRSPAPQAPAGFLAAADIRAMPEAAYGSLIAFLKAAVHELGQVLRRLARRG